MKEVEQIVEFKNYSMSLRDNVGAFTKQLIINLFDISRLHESRQEIRLQFLKILEVLYIEDGENLWSDFENHFVEIRKKTGFRCKSCSQK